LLGIQHLVELRFDIALIWSFASAESRPDVRGSSSYRIDLAQLCLGDSARWVRHESSERIVRD